MTSKILKLLIFSASLFALVNCSSANATPTKITIKAPTDQKYSVNFNIKESICIKNVEKLAKTMGKKGKTLAGNQTIPVVREIKDEDGQCPNSPAVLYFTMKVNKKAYSCLLSYAYGGKKITGFSCNPAKAKEKTNSCVAAKLEGKNAGEVTITC